MRGLLLLLLMVEASCSSTSRTRTNDNDTDAAAGRAGAAGSGGAGAGPGGDAGSSATGGAVGTSGFAGDAGSAGVGGSAAMGGIVGMGASVGMGGSVGNDASAGSGGTAGIGGSAGSAASGGSAGTGSCAADFADCDGMPGCETRVTNDPRHCGACNHDCLGGLCNAARCQPVELASVTKASWVVSPWGVALDATHVYFTVNAYGNAGQGHIGKVAKTGGAITDVTGGQRGPYDLAVDADYVFFTNNHATLGEVRRVSKDGGTAQAIASNQLRPVGISIDNTRVYWSSVDSGAVRSSDKLTAGVTDVAPGQDSPRATVVEPGPNGFLYFTALGDRVIKRLPKSGGAVQTISEVIDGPWGLARDPVGTDLFFTRFTIAGDVRRVAAAPGSRSVSIVPENSVSSSYYVAVDATHVYWTNHVATFGAVARAPKSGGPVEVLASNRSSPAGIAVDGTAIYWAESEGNSVWKLAK